MSNKLICINGKIMKAGGGIVLIQDSSPDHAILTSDNKALVDSNSNYLLFAEIPDRALLTLDNKALLDCNNDYLLFAQL